jgi:hypothetical protein
LSATKSSGTLELLMRCPSDSRHRARSFAPLDPFQTLRIVLPAATLIVLGFQTILSSFFLSVLGLRRR